MPSASRELEATALKEFADAQGKYFLVSSLCGYVGNDSVDLTCDPPILVKLTASSRKDDILHWNGDWLDPYWNVELITPRPAYLKEVRSTWIDGPSHNVHTRERDWPGITPVSRLTAMLVRLKTLAPA